MMIDSMKIHLKLIIGIFFRLILFKLRDQPMQILKVCVDRHGEPLSKNLCLIFLSLLQKQYGFFRFKQQVRPIRGYPINLPNNSNFSNLSNFWFAYMNYYLMKIGWFKSVLQLLIAVNANDKLN